MRAFNRCFIRREENLLNMWENILSSDENKVKLICHVFQTAYLEQTQHHSSPKEHYTSELFEITLWVQCHALMMFFFFSAGTEALKEKKKSSK